MFLCQARVVLLPSPPFDCYGMANLYIQNICWRELCNWELCFVLLLFDLGFLSPLMAATTNGKGYSLLCATIHHSFNESQLRLFDLYKADANAFSNEVTQMHSTFNRLQISFIFFVNELQIVYPKTNLLIEIQSIHHSLNHFTFAFIPLIFLFTIFACNIVVLLVFWMPSRQQPTANSQHHVIRTQSQTNVQFST